MATPRFKLESLTDTPGTLGIDEPAFEDAHDTVRDLWPLHECLGTDAEARSRLAWRQEKPLREIIYTWNGDDVMRLTRV